MEKNELNKSAGKEIVSDTAAHFRRQLAKFEDQSYLSSIKLEEQLELLAGLIVDSKSPGLSTGDLSALYEKILDLLPQQVTEREEQTSVLAAKHLLIGTFNRVFMAGSYYDKFILLSPVLQHSLWQNFGDRMRRQGDYLQARKLYQHGWLQAQVHAGEINQLQHTCLAGEVALRAQQMIRLLLAAESLPTNSSSLCAEKVQALVHAALATHNLIREVSVHHRQARYTEVLLVFLKRYSADDGLLAQLLTKLLPAPLQLSCGAEVQVSNQLKPLLTQAKTMLSQINRVITESAAQSEWMAVHTEISKHLDHFKTRRLSAYPGDSIVFQTLNPLLLGTLDLNLSCTNMIFSGSMTLDVWVAQIRLRIALSESTATKATQQADSLRGIWLQRIVDKTTEMLGPAPCDFCYLWSEGAWEQSELLQGVLLIAEEEFTEHVYFTAWGKLFTYQWLGMSMSEERELIVFMPEGLAEHVLEKQRETDQSELSWSFFVTDAQAVVPRTSLAGAKLFDVFRQQHLLGWGSMYEDYVNSAFSEGNSSEMLFLLLSHLRLFVHSTIALYQRQTSLKPATMISIGWKALMTDVVEQGVLHSVTASVLTEARATLMQHRLREQLGLPRIIEAKALQQLCTWVFTPLQRSIKTWSSQLFAEPEEGKEKVLLTFPLDVGYSGLQSATTLAERHTAFQVWAYHSVRHAWVDTTALRAYAWRAFQALPAKEVLTVVEELDALPKAEHFWFQLERKAQLFRWLNHFPQADGMRRQKKQKLQRWHETVMQLLEPVTNEAETSIIVELQPIQELTALVHERYKFKSTISSQLLQVDKQGNLTPYFKLPEKHSGLHIVLPVYPTNEQGIQGETPCAWLKLLPEQPGMEYAVWSLSERLCGGGTVLSTLLKISSNHRASSYSIAALLVQHASGVELNEVNCEKLTRLMPGAFTRQLFRVMVTNPEDDKGNDYRLQANESSNSQASSYDLVRIDNERAFFAGTKQVGGIFRHKKAHLVVKSVIYCFNQMHQPLDDWTLQEVSHLDPHALLQSWVSELQQVHARYQQLFSEKETLTHFDEIEQLYAVLLSKKDFRRLRHRFRRLNPPMKLSELSSHLTVMLPEYFLTMLRQSSDKVKIPFIKDLLHRLEAIIGIIRYYQSAKKKSLTGFELLSGVRPQLKRLYQKQFHSCEDAQNHRPFERFYQLTKQDYSYTKQAQLKVGGITPQGVNLKIANITGTSSKFAMQQLLGYSLDKKGLSLILAGKKDSPAQALAVLVDTQQQVADGVLNQLLTSAMLESEMVSTWSGLRHQFTTLSLSERSWVCNQLRDELIKAPEQYSEARQLHWLRLYAIAAFGEGEESGLNEGHFNAFAAVLNDETLLPILRNAGTALLRLCVQGAKKLTAKSLSKLCEYCPNLQYLDISATQLPKLIGYWPQLRVLVAKECQVITQIEMHAPLLRELMVSGSSQLSVIKTESKALKFVDLSGCSQCTDELLVHLGQHSWGIKDVNFAGCEKISHRRFREKYPYLMTLSWSEWDIVTLQVIDKTLQATWTELGKDFATVSDSYRLLVGSALYQHWHQVLEFAEVADDLLALTNSKVQNLLGWQLVKGLGFCRQSNVVVKELVSQLRDEDATLRRSAFETLPFLSTVMVNWSEAQQIEVLSICIAEINDEREYIRELGISALDVFSVMVASLSEVQQGNVMSSCVAMLESRNWNTRGSALQILAVLSTVLANCSEAQLNEMMAGCVTGLSDENWYVRESAGKVLDALESVGVNCSNIQQDEVMVSYVERLKNEDRNVRESACEALISLSAVIANWSESVQSRIIDHCVAMFKDTDSGVRQSALQVLATFSAMLANCSEEQKKTVVSRCFERVEDEDEYVRGTAFQTLVALSAVIISQSGDMLYKVVTSCVAKLKADSWYVRQSSIKALAAFSVAIANWSEARLCEILSDCAEGLSHENEGVRRSALEVLGVLWIVLTKCSEDYQEKVVSDCVARLMDTDGLVRLLTLRALRAFLTIVVNSEAQQSKVVTRCIALLKDEKEYVRESALEILVAISATPTGLIEAELCEVAVGCAELVKDKNWNIPSSAIKLLTALFIVIDNRSEIQLRGVVSDCLVRLKDEDERVRQSATQVLAALSVVIANCSKSQQENVVQSVTELLNSQDMRVCTAAIQTLSALHSIIQQLSSTSQRLVAKALIKLLDNDYIASKAHSALLLCFIQGTLASCELIVDLSLSAVKNAKEISGPGLPTFIYSLLSVLVDPTQMSKLLSLLVSSPSELTSPIDFLAFNQRNQHLSDESTQPSLVGRTATAHVYEKKTELHDTALVVEGAVLSTASIGKEMFTSLCAEDTDSEDELTSWLELPEAELSSQVGPQTTNVNFIVEEMYGNISGSIQQVGNMHVDKMVQGDYIEKPIFQTQPAPSSSQPTQAATIQKTALLPPIPAEILLPTHTTSTSKKGKVIMPKNQSTTTAPMSNAGQLRGLLDHRDLQRGERTQVNHLTRALRQRFVEPPSADAAWISEFVLLGITQDKASYQRVLSDYLTFLSKEPLLKPYHIRGLADILQLASFTEDQWVTASDVKQLLAHLREKSSIFDVKNMGSSGLYEGVHLCQMVLYALEATGTVLDEIDRETLQTVLVEYKDAFKREDNEGLGKWQVALAEQALLRSRDRRPAAWIRSGGYLLSAIKNVVDVGLACGAGVADGGISAIGAIPPVISGLADVGRAGAVVVGELRDVYLKYKGNQWYGAFRQLQSELTAAAYQLALSDGSDKATHEATLQSLVDGLITIMPMDKDKTSRKLKKLNSRLGHGLLPLLEQLIGSLPQPRYAFLHQQSARLVKHYFDTVKDVHLKSSLLSWFTQLAEETGNLSIVSLLVNAQHQNKPLLEGIPLTKRLVGSASTLLLWSEQQYQQAQSMPTVSSKSSTQALEDLAAFQQQLVDYLASAYELSNTSEEAKVDVLATLLLFDGTLHQRHGNATNIANHQTTKLHATHTKDGHLFKQAGEQLAHRSAAKPETPRPSLLNTVWYTLSIDQQQAIHACYARLYPDSVGAVMPEKDPVEEESFIFGKVSNFIVGQMVRGVYAEKPENKAEGEGMAAMLAVINNCQGDKEKSEEEQPQIGIAKEVDTSFIGLYVDGLMIGENRAAIGAAKELADKYFQQSVDREAATETETQNLVATTITVGQRTDSPLHRVPEKTTVPKLLASITVDGDGHYRVSVRTVGLSKEDKEALQQTLMGDDGADSDYCTDDSDRAKKTGNIRSLQFDDKEAAEYLEKQLNTQLGCQPALRP